MSTLNETFARVPASNNFLRKESSVVNDLITYSHPNLPFFYLKSRVNWGDGLLYVSYEFGHTGRWQVLNDELLEAVTNQLDVWIRRTPVSDFGKYLSQLVVAAASERNAYTTLTLDSADNVVSEVRVGGELIGSVFFRRYDRRVVVQLKDQEFRHSLDPQHGEVWMTTLTPSIDHILGSLDQQLDDYERGLPIATEESHIAFMIDLLSTLRDMNHAIEGVMVDRLWLDESSYSVAPMDPNEGIYHNHQESDEVDRVGSDNADSDDD